MQIVKTLAELVILSYIVYINVIMSLLGYAMFYDVDSFIAMISFVVVAGLALYRISKKTIPSLFSSIKKKQ